MWRAWMSFTKDDRTTKKGEHKKSEHSELNIPLYPCEVSRPDSVRSKSNQRTLALDS